MIGPPVDSPALHAGLVITAAVFVAVAGSVPAHPVPDAAGIAETVDRIAVDDGSATARHDHSADSVRLRPHGLAMRNDGGTARATFAFGPVVPVRNSDRLQTVLGGAPPQTVFGDRSAFRRATEAAQERSSRWEPSATITVTGVSWDGDYVVLIGA